VYYWVAQPCTVVLTITRPDSTKTTFGPKYVWSGTYSQLGEISYPLGTRTVTLQTSGGLWCSSNWYYNVKHLPVMFAPSGPGYSEGSGFVPSEYPEGYGSSEPGSGYVEGFESEWWD